MSQKKNFIMTSDSGTAEHLLVAGFQLVSQNNGIYTFLNQLPKNFSFDGVDKKKMAYNNMLNI
jgi:hypothetical protein